MWSWFAICSDRQGPLSTAICLRNPPVRNLYTPKRLTSKKWHNIFEILCNLENVCTFGRCFCLRWLTRGEINLSYHLYHLHNTLLLHFLRLGSSSLAVSKPRLSPLIFSWLKAAFRCEQLHTRAHTLNPSFQRNRSEILGKTFTNT